MRNHLEKATLARLNADLPRHMREQGDRQISQFSAATAAPWAKGEQPKSSGTGLAQRICASTMRSTYDGAELKRLCMRPGAYDALDLPSLRGTQRVAPQSPFCSP